jgi:hypothetical protein
VLDDPGCARAGDGADNDYDALRVAVPPNGERLHERNQESAKGKSALLLCICEGTNDWGYLISAVQASKMNMIWLLVAIVGLAIAIAVITVSLLLQGERPDHSPSSLKPDDPLSSFHISGDYPDKPSGDSKGGGPSKH